VIGKIISGGQTGVDRGALDAAIELGIPHGGWCPRGRRAEDGRIPDRYQLIETPESDYPTRTRMNVAEADATLIVVRRLPLRSGTAATEDIALRFGKPYMIAVLDVLELGMVPLYMPVRWWLEVGRFETLNVAGPRESKEPGIQAAVKAFLIEVLR
jgi:hypothetical protein